MIATGTPGGVGDSRTPPRYLREGDVVEISVEGVGTLRNPVRLERSAGASRLGSRELASVWGRVLPGAPFGAVLL